jgi:hypothetical protein
MPSLNKASECCPVCNDPSVKAKVIQSAIPYTEQDLNRTHCDDAVYFECCSCGEFVVTNGDCANLKSPRQRAKWNPMHVSALLREQTISGLPPFWLRDGMEPYGELNFNKSLTPIDLRELLLRWPRSVSEKLDRTVCNIAKLSPVAGKVVQINEKDCSIAFAEDYTELQFFREALIRRNLLDGEICNVYQWLLTVEGWDRYSELTAQSGDPQHPVFVAMWFGGAEKKAEMDKLFLDGIQPAVGEAGFQAERVDWIEHNDWIMDKVLGGIRLAPFVIADFTGHRNGVYFEAGFARGLGKIVINTCKADELENAHFDTKQLNHITWENAEELKKKLFHRILATVGKGPHVIS